MLAGIDLVRIADTADSLERFGGRYLRRLFTEAEVAACEAKGTGRIAALAARYAAKEALLKALAPEAAETPEWPLIEVVTAESGAPALRLHDAAQALARSRGVVSLSVSLTHEGEYASAVVVALCDA